MTIYLLGVYHTFQTEPCAEFSQYLRDLCTQKDIKSIAEEMNRDALDDANADKSTVAETARALGWPHAGCDPTKQERNERGILNKGAIEDLEWLGQITHDEAANLTVDCNTQREKFWIEKLRPMFVPPMLFVCGIDHLSSFSKLLESEGFITEVLDRKWELNQASDATSEPAPGAPSSSPQGLRSSERK